MSDSEEKAEGDRPYLIFSSGGEKYAVESSSVKEIVRNNTIYPVPFAPAYVKGIINWYSSPVAAVDWSMFLGQEEQTGRKETIFLVLNKDYDDIALLVGNVEEFKDTANVTRQLFPKSEDHGSFSGTISWKIPKDGAEGADEEDESAETVQMVPLLDLAAATEKIRRDLENG